MFAYWLKYDSIAKTNKIPKRINLCKTIIRLENCLKWNNCTVILSTQYSSNPAVLASSNAFDRSFRNKMEHRLWLLSLSTFQVKDILIFHVLIGFFFFLEGVFFSFYYFSSWWFFRHKTYFKKLKLSELIIKSVDTKKLFVGKTPRTCRVMALWEGNACYCCS